MIGPRIFSHALSLVLVCLIAATAWAQRSLSTIPEKLVVSYPSKSITNFPILETALNEKRSLCAAHHGRFDHLSVMPLNPSFFSK
jgi:hypothetical protein